MKAFPFFVAFIILSIALIFYTFLDKDYKDENKVCFKENCFIVEIADTEKERQKGLMYRTSLESDKGMLFIFNEEGIYPFWMKNTLIPLDILWLDKEGKIEYIEEDAQPCKNNEECKNIVPNNPGKYVLELNSGTAEKIGMKEGDKLNSLLFEN